MKVSKYWIYVFKISGKNDVISLKNSTLRELQVLIKSIFRYNFQFIIFILQESSKRCLIFSYSSAAFEKWTNLSRQELLFNHISQKCYISKDLQIIRKKADVLINVHLSCTAENLKRCCNAFGTWSSPSTTHSNHMQKQDRNFTSLVALIFLWIWCFIIWFFTCLIFWSHLLIKCLEAASNSCARKIVVLQSCKVDPLTITLGKYLWRIAE